MPLVITAPCNGLQSEIGMCRPNLIGDPNQFSGSRSKVDRENQWFNPNAFQAAFQTNPPSDCADPTIYNGGGSSETWGPQRAVRSPGFWNADMSLSKIFISPSALFQFSVGGVQCSEPSEPRDTQTRTGVWRLIGRFDRSRPPVRMSIR